MNSNEMRNNTHNALFGVSRVEKEKTQLKGEIEDLHQAVEHASKNKVLQLSHATQLISQPSSIENLIDFSFFLIYTGKSNCSI